MEAENTIGNISKIQKKTQQNTHTISKKNKKNIDRLLINIIYINQILM